MTDDWYGVPPGEVIDNVVDASAFRALADDLTDWWHGPFGLDAMHAAGHRGAGVTIAVLDTGVDTDHPDLRDGCAGLPHFDLTGSGTHKDRHGHGTHCAGLAAAASGNGGAVGGAPAAKVLAGKVLADSGSGRSDWTASGIDRAVAAGADIISMSLGSSGRDAQTPPAVARAIAKGCWVVAAAGNDGPNTINFPGGYPDVLAVAAVGQRPDGTLGRASFSSTNREVAAHGVAGPGVQTYSTLPGGRYGRMSGTSMATPADVGLLACVRGALKAAGRPIPDQHGLIAAIRATATDLGAVGPDNEYGAGALDPVKLLAYLMAADPTPPPPPPPAGQPVSLTIVLPPEAAGAKRLRLEFLP